ncbi:fumarate hydratase [Clostridiales bacterium PH28_bin88]|nr:fumarate hydratase [Clostridiales bacterium PH28_bin88]
MNLVSPLLCQEEIDRLRIYDNITISGKIFAGRDAVLPKLVKYFRHNRLAELNVDLRGSVIFHTAVSPAGIGPTSSNKLEIEAAIPDLSAAGVKIHLGKGSLGKETVAALKKYGSVFAVTPPVTALFSTLMASKRIAAFPEEGMEALFELEVTGLPAIIAIAHGESIFNYVD